MIDYVPRFEEGARRSKRGSRGPDEGVVDVQEGFQNIPKMFLRIFTGDNLGKQALRIADPPLPVPGR